MPTKKTASKKTTKKPAQKATSAAPKKPNGEAPKNPAQKPSIEPPKRPNGEEPRKPDLREDSKAARKITLPSDFVRAVMIGRGHGFSTKDASRDSITLGDKNGNKMYVHTDGSWTVVASPFSMKRLLAPDEKREVKGKDLATLKNHLHWLAGR